MNTAITFKNIGFGISSAGAWVPINGKDQWVHFLATAEGAGRHTRVTAAPRTWHVSASLGSVRVTLSKVNCNRTDAVSEVLKGLLEFLKGEAAKVEA